MKTQARALLVFTCALLALATIFPPWLYVHRTGNVRVEQSAGYACLLLPPKVPNVSYGIRVDYGRLALEWLVIAAVFGIASLMAAHMSNSPSSPGALRNWLSSQLRPEPHPIRATVIALSILAVPFIIVFMVWGDSPTAAIISAVVFIIGFFAFSWSGRK